jgi:hypothetical protein
VIAAEITVRWPDGTVGVFRPNRDGTWTQSIEGLRVVNYAPADVMRVLATATGTREVAPA